MSDGMSLILLAVVWFVFASISFTALVWPASFLRKLSNPFLPDTAWNRVQMRGLGLVFSLFTLYPLLMLSAGSQESTWHGRFRDNVLIALWTSFFTLPLLLWAVWLFSARAAVRRLQIEGLSEDPAWECRMTRLFLAVLFSAIALALFFAVESRRS
jgi:hypothetical protein